MFFYFEMDKYLAGFCQKSITVSFSEDQFLRQETGLFMVIVFWLWAKQVQVNVTEDSLKCNIIC